MDILIKDGHAGGFGAVTNFCKSTEDAVLKRPSGVCFDSSGRLYVTSMTGQVSTTSPSQAVRSWVTHRRHDGLHATQVKHTMIFQLSSSAYICIGP